MPATRPCSSAFCATSAYLLYSSLAHTGVSALVGVGVLAVGALLSFTITVTSINPSSQEEYVR